MTRTLLLERHFPVEFFNCTLFICFRVAAEVAHKPKPRVARYSAARANWYVFFFVIWVSWPFNFQIRESLNLQLCGLLAIRMSEWYLWFSQSLSVSYHDVTPAKLCRPVLICPVIYQSAGVSSRRLAPWGDWPTSSLFMCAGRKMWRVTSCK